MPTDTTNQMQRVPDWQVSVDASGNQSTLLQMDRTVGVDGRAFIESLDVNDETLITIDDISKEDAANALTDVTLDVDGVTATGVRNGRSFDLDLDLGAVRAVTKGTPVPDGHVEIITPGGVPTLKVQFPSLEEAGEEGYPAILVFSHRQSFPIGGFPLPNYTTILKFTSLTGAKVHPGFVGDYNISSGYFEPSQGGWYLVTMAVSYHLGAYADTLMRNWDAGIRLVAGTFQYASGADSSSQAGLSVTATLPLAAGQGIAPYFFHENGTPNPLPSATNFTFSIYKVGEIS